MTDMIPREEPDSRMTMGQTHLDPGDIVYPRVKILQTQSDEVANKAGAPGELFNTLTSENYGESLRFLPILAFKQRILLVRKERREAIDDSLKGAGLPELGEGDGLKCRSFDMFQGRGEPGIACNDCPLSQWRGNLPPLCTETYNVAASTELGELVVLSFSKSSARTGKQAFTMMRMGPQPPYSQVLELRTKPERNDQGNFHVAVVAAALGEDKKRIVSPPDLRAAAAAWARQLEGATIDVTPVGEDEGTPGEGPLPEQGDQPF